jgi:hypothetical protein
MIVLIQDGWSPDPANREVMSAERLVAAGLFDVLKDPNVRSFSDLTRDFKDAGPIASTANDFEKKKKPKQ